MKVIPLSRGAVAVVDDEDFDELSKYSWYLHPASTNLYAARNEGNRAIMMHDQIMNPPNGMEVDHIRGLTLDNRRSELRICTHAQNQRNMRLPRSNKSGYKGVHFSKAAQKWQAGLRVDGKTLYLGVFADIIDAARAYNDAATKHYGEFARLNEIKPEEQP